MKTPCRLYDLQECRPFHHKVLTINFCVNDFHEIKLDEIYDQYPNRKNFFYETQPFELEKRLWYHMLLTYVITNEILASFLLLIRETSTV